jgi:hypothetical protein
MNFLFLYGDSSENEINSILLQAKRLWGEVEYVNYGTFYLFYPKPKNSKCFMDSDRFLGILDGWGGIHNENTSINKFFALIDDNWPVKNEELSGCFCGLIFNKNFSKLKIFSDLAGIYPIYVAEEKKYCIGGTSLILIGRILRRDLDIIGVLQRISWPDWTNFGYRTILKGVKKIQSGEMKIYDNQLSSRSIFDNSLYGQSELRNLHEQAQSLWQLIKEEVDTCIGENDVVNVGMSGGWDSRTIAGALDDPRRKLRFFTYGMSEDGYEVEIGRSIAKILSAEFVFCDVFPDYFPSYERFAENMIEGESTHNTEWFSVLNAAPSDKKEIILLGDSFEAICGYYITNLSSRKSRQIRFINPIMSKKLLIESNQSDFNQWAIDRMKKTVKRQMRELPNINPTYFENISPRLIEEGLREDLDITFQRIMAYNPPYSVLYDELYMWLTKGQLDARQFLCLKQKFTPLAPTMGMRTIQATSKIDPIARADGRLFQEIQHLPDFRRLSKLPSAAIPYVPSSYPLFVKNLVWGGRSYIDKYLTERAITRKDPSARISVLNSINLVKLYNHPEVSKRIESWFTDSIYSNYQPLLEIVERRAKALSWPWVNTDIIAKASACILAKLIDIK